MKWFALGALVLVVGVGTMQDNQSLGIGLVVAACFVGLFGLTERLR